MAVKRPKEHVKETKSFKIFNDSVPDEWISRRIEQDYALDFAIEIVEDGVLSGKTLLVQVKSSDSFSVETGVASYQFETSKLQYYLQKDVPVLLVLVDLSSEKSYWLFVQEHVYEKIERTNYAWAQQKTISIRIPAGNVWLDCLDKIRDVAFEGPFYLAMKKISSIQTGKLLSWRKNVETLTELEGFKEKMTEKAQEIGLELSYRYMKEGRPEEAMTATQKVYDESKADSMNLLKAIAALVWQYNIARMDENRAIFQLASEGVRISQKLNSEPYFLYFKGIAIEAVFFKMAGILENELILKKVSQQTKSSLVEPFLAISASQTTRRLHEVKSDFVSNLDAAGSSQQFFVFTDLLRRFARMQLFLYQSLIAFIDSERMGDLLNSAKAALDLSMEIADISKQVDIKCVILENLGLFYHLTNNVEMRRRALKECIELSEKSEHKGFAASCKEKYALYERAPRFIRGPKDIPESTGEDFDKLSDEEIDKMHRFLLEKAGIDIDGDDEFAELARVGLKDRNPERVLRHCSHLYVEVVTYGPIWDMVGLTTTGTKLLFCEEKGFIVGWKLDDILARFKRKYCSGCAFHSPRPQEWKWTYRWQRERGTPPKMKEVIRNLRRS